MNPEVEHILALAGVDVGALELTHQYPDPIEGVSLGTQYQFMGEYPIVVYDHGDAGLSIYSGWNLTHGMVNIYRSGIFA